MTTKHELFLCDCKDPEHQLIISYDTLVDDYYWEEMYVTVHLPRVSLWRRCVYAVRYICGWRSSTGAFTEMVLRDTQVAALRDTCNEHLTKLEEYRRGYQRN